MSTWSRALFAVVLGGVLATAGDQAHVAFGVLSYPEGGQPWWVLPEMVIATASLLAGYQVAVPQESHLKFTDVLAPAGWFMGTYLATSPLAPWPWALSVALLGLFIVRAQTSHLSTPVLLYCAAVGIGGGLVEGLISASGLFGYTESQLSLIPIWLPFLYLHVALAVRALGRWVFQDR